MHETWKDIAEKYATEGHVTLGQLNIVIGSKSFRRKFEGLLSKELDPNQIREIVNEEMSYAERVEMTRLFSVLSGETEETP